MRAHPYSRLETWEWENAHVAFDAAELKLPRLGYMVENNVLQQALWQALEAHPRVTLRVPASIKELHPHESGYLLTLDSGDELAVKLVVGADGANSQVRQMAGIGVHAWQYEQSCMLITVECENAPGESTWQHFTPNGPHAFFTAV
ncbi:2-octaprenyl-3-methyl-6-methoxy-1,4-benzoquinol hydroxylase [Enterobacter asburiae]|uniref:2-octaprenyl-3-methyl-6-methoxy-1,4-benzoquinol hydroxylase n=1 Tax=Enterobacter asburiae TaxID=61645 RepID=A0A376F593_ENTAS|nr:2-octaprenyl-3-methyl-6-methoxy-1,4-benzoquinol hydroxylase [Enterobacter asburiae]